MARRLLLTAVVVSLLVAACERGGGSDDARTPASPNGGAESGAGSSSPPPTLSGGIELPAVDPATLLVGDGIAFGAALPSEEAAAATFTEGPEVAGVTDRRVYAADGRHLGEVVLLHLDGAGFFDEQGLDAWQAGLVGALAGGDATQADVAGTTGYVAAGQVGTVIGFREGDVLVVVTAPLDQDAQLVASAIRVAHGRGDPARPDPATPMRPTAPGDLFVAVPALSFVPFPPAEEEAPPPVPQLGGLSGGEGRIGAIGGERRATVWALVTNRQAVPTAEVLGDQLAQTVSQLAGGITAQPVEIVDRVVFAADGGEAGSARAFRHGDIAVVVSGADPADLDAIASAWITALGPP